MNLFTEITFFSLISLSKRLCKIKNWRVKIIKRKITDVHIYKFRINENETKKYLMLPTSY